jgi:hypothetical protein
MEFGMIVVHQWEQTIIGVQLTKFIPIDGLDVLQDAHNWLF